jgi:hypothetical protein
MKKCKILNQSDQEVAIILIWSADNHKVGMVLIVPYIANVIKEAYLTDTSDDSIITDLLNKANLIDVKIKCN